jgi:hypothetical protein
MLRHFTRIPLRRCLHTPPKRPPPIQGSNFTLVLGIGAMLAAVTYMSNSNGRRIALDAQPVAGELSLHQFMSLRFQLLIYFVCVST